jgi:hypothetical protein
MHGNRSPLTPFIAGIAKIDNTIAVHSVIEEEVSTKRVLSLAVPPEEYEWLTINLENYAWESDVNGEDPGKLLGRYYRLALLSGYVLQNYGDLNLEEDIFSGELEVGGVVLDMNPVVDRVSNRKDTARLRYAGGVVVRTMGLSPDDETELRDYLKHSIDARVRHALDVVRFCHESNRALPPNLDESMAHWLGVCLPLVIETKDLKLWEPDGV